MRQIMILRSSAWKKKATVLAEVSGGRPWLCCATEIAPELACHGNPTQAVILLMRTTGFHEDEV